MVNMQDAKTHWSRLVARAEAGEQIIIARNGRPVARLVPYTEGAERRIFGRMKGRITIADDFDTPLPPEIHSGLEGPSDT
jgi:prevent-host-death family protein